LAEACGWIPFNKENADSLILVSDDAGQWLQTVSLLLMTAALSPKIQREIYTC